MVYSDIAMRVKLLFHVDMQLSHEAFRKTMFFIPSTFKVVADLQYAIATSMVDACTQGELMLLIDGCYVPPSSVGTSFLYIDRSSLFIV